MRGEAEQASRRRDSGALYQIVRRLTPRPPVSPVAAAWPDGTPTATCAEAAKVWARHYADTYSGD
eukprot:10834382-Alexandrium_andersonii.AAC.1